MRAVVIAPAFVSVAASETGFKVAQQPFLPDAHGFQDHFFPTGHGQDNVAGGGNGIGGICGSGLVPGLERGGGGGRQEQAGGQREGKDFIHCG